MNRYYYSHTMILGLYQGHVEGVSKCALVEYKNKSR